MTPKNLTMTYFRHFIIYRFNTYYPLLLNYKRPFNVALAAIRMGGATKESHFNWV